MDSGPTNYPLIFVALGANFLAWGKEKLTTEGTGHHREESEILRSLRRFLWHGLPKL
jgi:hypothetical protein